MRTGPLPTTTQMMMMMERWSRKQSAGRGGDVVRNSPIVGISRQRWMKRKHSFHSPSWVESWGLRGKDCDRREDTEDASTTQKRIECLYSKLT
jgi:hypothetical protein